MMTTYKDFKTMPVIGRVITKSIEVRQLDGLYSPMALDQKEYSIVKVVDFGTVRAYITNVEYKPCEPLVIIDAFVEQYIPNGEQNESSI